MKQLLGIGKWSFAVLFSSILLWTVFFCAASAQGEPPSTGTLQQSLSAAPTPAKTPIRIRDYYPPITFDQKKTKEERWKALLEEFPSRDPNVSAEKKKKLEDAFLAEDVDQMPPELRFQFLGRRLSLYIEQGNWQGVLAVRDKLMAPQQRDPKRSLLDVELLQEIAAGFCNSVFPPPGGAGKYTAEEMMKYWQTHYKNEAEVERIHQYIVDHFDLNYFRTVDSLRELADSQGRNKKGQQALDTWKRFEAVDSSKLYCLPDSLAQISNSGKGQLEDAIKNNKKSMPIYAGSMIYSASQLQPDQAQKEIKDIAKRYGYYKEVQNKAKVALVQVVAGAANWKPPVEPEPSPVSPVVAQATPRPAVSTPASASPTPALPTPTPSLPTPTPAPKIAARFKIATPAESAGDTTLLFYGSAIVILGLVGGGALLFTRKKK